jgi:hypothetical protein
MEEIRSSETSVYTRYTRRHIIEDGIFHCHRCENLKFYIIFYILPMKLQAMSKNILRRARLYMQLLVNTLKISLKICKHINLNSSRLKVDNKYVRVSSEWR